MRSLQYTPWVRSWSAHAALLICALLCSRAVAQTPIDAATQAQRSLAALSVAPAAGAAPDAVKHARDAEAATLVGLVVAGGLPAESAKQIDAGVAKLLLGPDATARDALLAAIDGRRGVTLRWWDPILTLARDPQRPPELTAPAVRCLGAANWRRVAGELIEAFEDAAAPPLARVRAIEASGALARIELPAWGPVGPLVKALSDGAEPVRLGAERELERLLLLPDATTAAELRRWWESVKTAAPSFEFRERARREVAKSQAQRDQGRATELAYLPHLSVEGLILALASEFVEVRTQTAELLRTCPDPERTALAPLTARLSSEPDAAVREAIIRAVAARVQAADIAVLQRLQTMAAEKHERYPSVRREAVRALARHPVASSAPAVLDALVTDTSPVVREAAAEALTGFAGQVDVAMVAKALDPANEKTAAVRVAVARTLGKLGEAPKGDAAACGPLALAAKSDPDENVRWQAVFGLGSVVCPGSDAVAAMLHALRPDETPRVRKLAVGQLGKRKNPAEFDRIAVRLVDALGDADAEVAGASADGLRRLGANDAYRLKAFAEKAEQAGQLRGAAVLYEAGVKVVPDVPDGANAKALSEADALKVRIKLVSLWPRAGDAGRAIPHAHRVYQENPTPEGARTVADLSVLAGQLAAGMTALREAAGRFADQADELKDHGVALLFKRVSESTETLEVAAASALEEIGALPADAQWMADYLRAGAQAARELDLVSRGDAAAGTQLHERLRNPTGWALGGHIEACLRRVAADHALGVQADAALRAVGADRFPPPATGPPEFDWTAEQRRVHQATWWNAWLPVKAALTRKSK